MQSSYERQSRVVNISVLDRDGNHAQGAKLTFAIGGTEYGDVTIGDGPASIEIPDLWITIDVSAMFAGELQLTHLSPGQNQYIFHFSKFRKSRGITPGVARCPDGTVGQPCVDCLIDGVLVRICA